MLKTLRKNKKLTQKDLSEISGLSQNYISELENYPAESNPTVNTLIKLGEVLDINSEILYKYFVDKKLEKIGKRC